MPRPSPCWASSRPSGPPCAPGGRNGRHRDGVLHPRHRREGLRPGFGFTLGCTTLFASALITGGVGPWMPVPDVRVRLGRALRRAPPAGLGPSGGAHAGHLRGASPVMSSGSCSISRSGPSTSTPQQHRLPAGRALAANVHRYLVFDATTSLGWDTGGPSPTFVCILLVGPAMLATFRRAARRAAFEAPVTFTDPAGSELRGTDHRSRAGWIRRRDGPQPTAGTALPAPVTRRWRTTSR